MSLVNNRTFLSTNVKPVFGNVLGTLLYQFAWHPSKLLYKLKWTMIRHTKQQVLSGQEVPKLPPKTKEAVEGECVCGGRGCSRGAGWL